MVSPPGRREGLPITEERKRGSRLDGGLASLVGSFATKFTAVLRSFSSFLWCCRDVCLYSSPLFRSGGVMLSGLEGERAVGLAGSLAFLGRGMDGSAYMEV
jgi:hypothetical protein